MAEFIVAAVDGLKALLAAHTAEFLGDRVPFTHFGVAFRGQVMNPPELWVEPMNTMIGEEGNFQNQLSELRVKLGIVDSDPEALTYAVMAYVAAVSNTIAKYEFVEMGGDTIKRVYVQEHNYGPLRVAGAQFAAFPEIYVVVGMAEL